MWQAREGASKARSWGVAGPGGGADDCLAVGLVAASLALSYRGMTRTAYRNPLLLPPALPALPTAEIAERVLRIALSAASGCADLPRYHLTRTELQRRAGHLIPEGPGLVGAVAHALEERPELYPDLRADAPLLREHQAAADSFEIGFNARYLMDILAQVEGDTVEVHLADAAAPTLIRENDKASALYVLMPMRV